MASYGATCTPLLKLSMASCCAACTAAFLETLDDVLCCVYSHLPWDSWLWLMARRVRHLAWDSWWRLLAQRVQLHSFWFLMVYYGAACTVTLLETLHYVIRRDVYTSLETLDGVLLCGVYCRLSMTSNSAACEATLLETPDNAYDAYFAVCTATFLKAQFVHNG